VRPALILALLGSCGPPPAAGPLPEYPGTLTAVSELRSPSALGEAFAFEHRVRSESPEGTHEFRAVLQKQGDTLVIVGLGPHGGRGFSLTQRGEEIEFESQLPRELPFPPRFMLLDVHRVWFRGLDGPLPDGEHRGELDGEEIVERWENSRLMERNFRRIDGEPPGLIRVIYEGGLGGDEPPPVVRYDNGWFGYRLTITTLSHQRIEETSGGSEAQGEPGSDR
jgi:hypothetical protein